MATAHLFDQLPLARRHLCKPAVLLLDHLRERLDKLAVLRQSLCQLAKATLALVDAAKEHLRRGACHAQRDLVLGPSRHVPVAHKP